MATELAKAYVQIIPSTQGIGSQLTSAISGEVSKAGDSSGQTFGSSLVSTIKKIVVSAGLGTVLKETLNAGGALQQSFGGLDTIYGEASAAAKQYAKDAAAAGISANDYAEQAVSFGAALKMAFSGDTTKAVEAANTAIMDMTDNAAKMGTPLESIQNAYQGFAKQNYTMLDNLKLGYGGTKEEMQRLLADAEKLSGVKYDLSNLGDVYSAIHVIQEDLGLTGVAADEASTTFTGSMGAMKAAAENLMANLALGESIEEPLNTLLGNTQVFFKENFLPMIENVLTALPDVLDAAFTFAIRSLNQVGNNAEEIVDFGVTLITKLAETIVNNAPYIADSALNLVVALGKALINHDWSETVNTMVTNMKDGLSLASGEILGSDDDIVTAIIQSITDNLPSILDKGIEIINTLVDGMLRKIPDVIDSASKTLNTFANTILDNLPTILDAGLKLISKLADGIIKNLPKIVESSVKATTSFINTINEHLPEIIEKGMEIIAKLTVGIIKALPDIIKGVAEITSGMSNAFLSIDWIKLGKNIIDGVVQGIKDGASAVWEAVKEVCQEALNSAKDFFKIASPSKLMRDQIGKFIPEGIAVGITANSDSVTNAIDSLTDNTVLSAQRLKEVSVIKSGANVTPATSQGIDLILNMLETYLPKYATKDQMNNLNFNVNNREFARLVNEVI